MENTPQNNEPTQSAPVQSDRTREQFEKLLESNRRLSEQNQQMQSEFRQAMQGATQQPANQNNRQEQPNAWDFYTSDPQTGETVLDQNKFENHMKQITTQAKKAEETVESYIKSVERREIDRQNKEAYSNYPELNPENTDKFDKEFYRQTRGILTDSMMNADEYGGNPLSFKEAADLVKSFRTPEQVKADSQKKQEGPTDAEVARDAARSGGNSAAPTQSQRTQVADEDLERLRYDTRRGGERGNMAIAQRLANIDHVIDKTKP